MARQRVSLWIRIKTADGKRPYVRPVPKRNGYALVGGKPEAHIADGVYHLRYEVAGKRIWEPVGQNYQLAEAQRKIREGELDMNQVATGPKDSPRLTLAEQKERFLELKRLTKKQDGTRLDKETIIAYEQEVTEFLAVVRRKTYADEIDGMDLRRYMAVLEQRGLTHRTICNKYTSIATFLRFCRIDHKELLPQNERPRPDDGDPEAYTQEEIIRFLCALRRERDRLAFEFLLKTGAREREMTCACWSDISGVGNPVFKIQNHPELGFRTKTGKSRAVPLEKGLYERLMMWKEKNPGTKLIFGTSGDRVDTHFLEVCKETARRAGLNCGECDSCKKKQECKSWYLHKFRATFATWALRAGTDIRTVQSWMGHGSISMTERYLEAATGSVVQARINAAFGGLNLNSGGEQSAVIM